MISRNDERPRIGSGVQSHSPWRFSDGSGVAIQWWTEPISNVSVQGYRQVSKTVHFYLREDVNVAKDLSVIAIKRQQISTKITVNASAALIRGGKPEKA